MPTKTLDPILIDFSGSQSSPEWLTWKKAAPMLAQQYSLLIAPDQVVELRALDVRRGYGRPQTHAGFFEAARLPCMAGAGVGGQRQRLPPPLSSRTPCQRHWSNRAHSACAG